MRVRIINWQLNHQGKATVFFDQSMELRRSLKKIKNIDLREVQSRELNAIEMSFKSIELLRPLIEKCDSQISKITVKLNAIQKKLLKKNDNQLNFIFYLNHFVSSEKKPKIIIVNDGFVKNLLSIKFPFPII